MAEDTPNVHNGEIIHILLSNYYWLIFNYTHAKLNEIYIGTVNDHLASYGYCLFLRGSLMDIVLITETFVKIDSIFLEMTWLF